MQVFYKKKLDFRPVYVSEHGVLAIDELLNRTDEWPNQSGIGELVRIDLEDHMWRSNEFLTVLEGHAKLSNDDNSIDLAPGDSVYMREGERVTIHVADRLLWAWTAYTPSGDWRNNS